MFGDMAKRTVREAGCGSSDAQACTECTRWWQCAAVALPSSGWNRSVVEGHRGGAATWTVSQWQLFNDGVGKVSRFCSARSSTNRNSVKDLPAEVSTKV